jgi:ABC-2 type transport system permease protein
MDALALYGAYARASIKAQMAYPGSFLLQSVGQFFATIIEFLGIWILFDRFGRLDAWKIGEVAIFYAVVNIGFAIADTLTRGFDVFGPEFVKTGNFDRLLLRPRSAAFQLFGHELRLSRIGRFLQAAIVGVVGAQLLHFAWTPAAAAIAVFAVSGCVALFCGLLILQATLSFWTVEGLEIVNTVTYGGVEASQVPMSIYARWFREFLTYVVPLACVAYFPVLALLGKASMEGLDPALAALTPVVGYGFMAFALWIWGFGVRRYTSTGS